MRGVTSIMANSLWGITYSNSGRSTPKKLTKFQKNFSTASKGTFSPVSFLQRVYMVRNFNLLLSCPIEAIALIFFLSIGPIRHVADP
jgi:hypothetical protein